MFPICRFCLCDNETRLDLIATSLDGSLTIESVERFTGIQLHHEEHGSYALCRDCAEKLKQSVAFRDNCLANSALFEQLY
ncbi:AGAP012742-PA, partial [Anopheles gambiae str. PEST]